MAIANTLIPPEPGSALMALLTQGVGAVSGAINNAINIGQSRAATQLGQEKTLFDVLQNQRNFNLRKSEDLRRNLETDRLFGRTVARDEVSDATDARNFARNSFVQDRSFTEGVREADRAYDLGVKKTDAAIQSDKDRLGIAASKNELDAIKTNISLLNLNDTRDIRNDLRDRTNTLRDDALSSTTSDALTTPGQAKTLPVDELTNYIDLFKGVGSPDVAARVNVASRELASRAPTTDPLTGKVIPSKFAPDRTNPFVGKTPQEAVAVAANIQSQINDLDSVIEAAKAKSPGRTNTALSSLFKQRSALVEQLNKGPAASPDTTKPKGGVLGGVGSALDWLKNQK